MQLRYRAICGWLMRAEFSNPVHFHCSLLVRNLSRFPIYRIYTPTSDGSREASHFPNSADLTRAPTFGLGRLDSARLGFPMTSGEYRDCEEFWNFSYSRFVFLFFKSRNNSRDNSITNIDSLFTPSSFLQKFNYPNENASRDKSGS